MAEVWVQAYVRHYQDEHVRAATGSGRSRPLGKLVRDYLEHRRLNFAPNTVQSDRSALNQLLGWCGKDLPSNRVLVAPDRDRLAGYAYLQDLVNERVREGYEPTTLRTWATCWAPFFDWLGSKLDVWDLDLPAVPETDARAWTDDELRSIRKAADYVDRKRREPDWPSARVVVEFFLASGCRQQEGYAAEWSRIRRSECTIRLVGQLNRDHRAIVPLKGKRNRTALLLPSWWDYYDARGKGYVLGRADGVSLGYRPQVNIIDRVLDAAQLNEPRAGYHRFRHTYARLFVEQGGTLESLRESLGHSSIVTTDRTYGHLAADVAAEIARQRIYGTAGKSRAHSRPAFL